MLLPGQTRFGPRRTAIQRRLRRFHNRRIVRALAFYQGWWGVRPKSPVTSQPPRLVDLLYRSSYTLFQGGLPAALLTIPLRDAAWPLTVMLAHKAVPHECRHLLFTTMCSAIPTSPDSGLTSRCGWTAKTNPPAKAKRPSFHLSSGCHMATHFMLAHKAVPDGCRHLSLLLYVSRYQLAQL